MQKVWSQIRTCYLKGIALYSVLLLKWSSRYFFKKGEAFKKNNNNNKKTLEFLECKPSPYMKQ